MRIITLAFIFAAMLLAITPARDSFACWPPSREAQVTSAETIATGHINHLIAVGPRNTVDGFSCYFPTSQYLFDVDRYLKGSGPEQIVVYGDLGYTKRDDDFIVIVNGDWAVVRTIDSADFDEESIESLIESSARTDGDGGRLFLTVGIGLIVIGAFLVVGSATLNRRNGVPG